MRLHVTMTFPRTSPVRHQYPWRHLFCNRNGSMVNCAEPNFFCSEFQKKTIERRFAHPMSLHEDFVIDFLRTCFSHWNGTFFKSVCMYISPLTGASFSIHSVVLCTLVDSWIQNERHMDHSPGIHSSSCCRFLPQLFPNWIVVSRHHWNYFKNGQVA